MHVFFSELSRKALYVNHFLPAFDFALLSRKKSILSLLLP